MPWATPRSHPHLHDVLSLPCLSQDRILAPDKASCRLSCALACPLCGITLHLCPAYRAALQVHPGHQVPYGMPAPPMAQQQGFLPANDPMVAMGTNIIRQSGATYLESGKRYMQSWTGVLSGAMLQHQFEISASYGELSMPSSSLMSIILWPCYTRP